MTEEEFKESISGTWHIPTKAFNIINHANNIHPDRPIIVTYETDPLANILCAEFCTAPVAGMPGKFRSVFQYSGKLRTAAKKRQMLADFERAVEACSGGAMPPPVLVAQCSTFCWGTDGLQVGTLQWHA
jgi:hypothetical protein